MNLKHFMCTLSRLYSNQNSISQYRDCDMTYVWCVGSDVTPTSIDQSISHVKPTSINQSCKTPKNRLLNQSVNQPINRSINQSHSTICKL